MAQKDDKIVYPPGVRELTGDISTDDLVRRLKECADKFQNMSQDDDNSVYIPLAELLATETFLEHHSQDVQLLVACCIADIFRVYAPDAPYKDLSHLKVIFEFLVEQLKGLEDPSKPSFKRYFYLLENFTCVKTFNICVELEDNQKILCRLFKLMFKIVNENHSPKVKKFMLDMLSPLISEADVVSQELLDIILGQIIEPLKTQNRNACSLAQDILRKNIPFLEPCIQSFFNNALILGKTLESEIVRHLYELIYELNGICPSMLTVVLPQLEFKLKISAELSSNTQDIYHPCLKFASRSFDDHFNCHLIEFKAMHKKDKSNEEQERQDVTLVLARMFSDKGSRMIEENKTLWACFLNRFNDISPKVRICCVRFCNPFLLNHPESKDDITEQLKQRHRDVDENVRFEVVSVIVNTAKKDFSCVSEELLSFVKERTLDKKFKIRKQALYGLAQVYRDLNKGSPSTSPDLNYISWIKNKVLHAYYQTSVEDRFLVERILNTCLVPYQKPSAEKMKLLYQLYCSVDDHAVKAFKEIMRCQSQLRTTVRIIFDVIQNEKNDEKQKNIANKVSIVSKSLQDPVKSNDCILKFCRDLESNLKLRNMMSDLLNPNISCSEAELRMLEILKIVGQCSPYGLIIKQLLERIAPVMIDKEGIRHLVECVKDSVVGECIVEAELGLQNSSHRGLELLWVLTFVYPSAFYDENIYNNLLLLLHVEDDIAVDFTLQIFKNISNDMEINYPDFSVKLLPILENFVETGTAKQAKHAVYCINSIVTDKEKVFGNIIQNLKKHFTLKSQYFRTALVSVGHIAYLCHNMFAADLKMIVAQIVVKDLLMLDQDLPRGGDDTWGPLNSLPDETKVKIEGMKVMVRWLAGLKDMVTPAVSTLRLLNTVILHDGDLMERQHTAPVENSWMRLSAANCMLKLCQEPNYAKVITLDQFQVLAFMINDKCPEVRDAFAQKIHKGLYALKLPLEFMAVFALAGLDERKEFKTQVKSYLVANINKRKDYIKSHNLTEENLCQVLPDYALPHAVHLLAHYPGLKTYNDVPALQKIKDCLGLLMEPMIVKNENYSFAFFKRLLENIKQTKDQQAPDDPNTNMKLYAVADLALSIIMSKSTKFVLKDFPVNPTLPSKLYTEPDLSYSNMKTYLPPEFISDKTLKSGIEIAIFEASKEAVSQNQSSITPDLSNNNSQSEISISDVTSRENDNTAESTLESRATRASSRTRKKNTRYNPHSDVDDTDSLRNKTTNSKNNANSDIDEIDNPRTRKKSTRSNPDSDVDDTDILRSRKKNTRNNPNSDVDDTDSLGTRTSNSKNNANSDVDEVDSQRTRKKNTRNNPNSDVDDTDSLRPRKKNTRNNPNGNVDDTDSLSTRTSNSKNKANSDVNEIDSLRTRKKNTRNNSNSDVNDTDAIITENSEDCSMLTKDDSRMQEPLSPKTFNDINIKLKNPVLKIRPLRSSRLTSTSSDKSTKSSCGSYSDKQNGILRSEFEMSSLCSSDIPSSIKECNVSLRKDEVERYIALNNSSDDPNDDDDFQQESTTNNKSNKITDPSSNVKKRKREVSPVSRSVKSKSSTSGSNKSKSSTSGSVERKSSTSSSVKSKSSTSSSVKSKSSTSSSVKSKSSTSLHVKQNNSLSQPLKARSNSSSSVPRNNSASKKGNKLPLVNGDRRSKVPLKGKTSHKNQKPGSHSPLKRNQRNQVKPFLRKR